MDEADTVNGLGDLGDADTTEAVLDMEGPSMVKHLGHGMVGTVLERLNGTEVIYIIPTLPIFLIKEWG